jgi:hypothetical protein
MSSHEPACMKAPSTKRDSLRIGLSAHLRAVTLGQENAGMQTVYVWGHDAPARWLRPCWGSSEPAVLLVAPHGWGSLGVWTLPPAPQWQLERERLATQRGGPRATVLRAERDAYMQWSPRRKWVKSRISSNTW